MSKRIEQLQEINRKMAALKDSDDLSPENIITGLLLTIFWLADDQPFAISRLASTIHADAQTAWAKIRKQEEPNGLG